MPVGTRSQFTWPVAGLDVSVFHEGGTTVVAVCGEADSATLSVVVDALARVVAENDGDVIVDLAQTAFIDTAALRAVLRVREELRGRGRQLTLRSPARVPRRLLAAFGLIYLVTPAAA